MRDLPTGFDERWIPDALTAWDIDTATLTHAPVGFGDHHWRITDTSGWGWFATVADLEHKTFLGADPETVLTRLEGAMDTAARLREDQGLDFVVAPLRSADGSMVRPIGGRYALSVLPWVEGESGGFGDTLPAERRDRVLLALAELHRSARPRGIRELPVGLEGTDLLFSAVADPGGLGDQGPFSTRVGGLLAEHGDVLMERLTGFERGAAGVDRSRSVVTHGEPHPGNLLWCDGRPRLVDWDTVGVAVPERDLWPFADDPEALTRYTEGSGLALDRDLLDLYRLRWDLRDVVEFVDLFAGPHEHGPDTERAYRGLSEVLARLEDGD